jgi:hypothetical protein
MTPDVETEHRPTDDSTDTETIHTVVLTDAAGRETRYPYRATGDAHEFIGDGEPTERAEQAIEAFEDADTMDEFVAAVEGGDE